MLRMDAAGCYKQDTFHGFSDNRIIVREIATAVLDVPKVVVSISVFDFV